MGDLVPEEVCDEVRGKDRKYPGDVLAIAVHAGCFASLEALHKAYEQLQAYGSGMPPFRQTVLLAEFRNWQDALRC